MSFALLLTAQNKAQNIVEHNRRHSFVEKPKDEQILERKPRSDLAVTLGRKAAKNRNG